MKVEDAPNEISNVANITVALPLPRIRPKSPLDIEKVAHSARHLLKLQQFSVFDRSYTRVTVVVSVAALLAGTIWPSGALR